MTDPSRGGQPKSEGASTGRRKGGSHRRRGKGKKAGPAMNGLETSASAGSAAASVPERRSETVIADGPIRKRKRRRRGKGAGAPSANPQTLGVTRSGEAQSMRPVGSTGGAVVADGASGSQVRHPQSQASERHSDPARGSAGAATGEPLATRGDQPQARKGRRNRSRRGHGLKPGHVRPLTGSEPPSAAHKARAVDPAPTPKLAPAKSHAPRPPQGPVTERPRSTWEFASDDLYAALDLGTNNCRLLIAQPTRPGQFRVVDAFSRIVRLGEGLGATGRLSQDAMDRAVEALRICASKLAGRDIRRMRLIATEACRAAENGELFLERVTAETGLKLEIINRETEARLAVSGCSSLVGREARSVVLFDIGGGSSEIAVIRIADNRSSRLANHITHWTSLPVGVVTLSERHGGRDVTPDVFEAMTREVEGMLERFDCPDLGFGPGGVPDDFHLIGTSGTVTTLAGVHLDLPRYDRRKVDGLWLTDAEVTAMQAKLLSWDYAGRAANPCIGPDRADLVLAGCAILEAIRRRWPSSRMRVADRGLREGLLTDMMADDGVWRRGRSRRPHPAPQTSRER
ncbi:Ppx/GppA phosphatase family protein [Rhizobium glycinendophyticum]|uniref:Ppx/GppA family phosphatase n=1 Tax=Rhizobium glycinendophyticum TaxID=2589807 RepID=A0A504ULM3_9HYPH|nr:Ppx/GppA phosphatase family protein [Rhizobium glycinendophyticum]TPP10006.1 Ppx/GppA family phosphatase [Rhizobium glycinendophyticum]